MSRGTDDGVRSLYPCPEWVLIAGLLTVWFEVFRCSATEIHLKAVS